MQLVILFTFVLLGLEGCGMFEGAVVETGTQYNEVVPYDPATGDKIDPGDPVPPEEPIDLVLRSGKYCSFTAATDTSAYFIRNDSTADGAPVGGPRTRMYTRGSNNYGLRTGDPDKAADSDVPFYMTLFPLGVSIPTQIQAGTTHMGFIDTEDDNQTYPSWANLELFGINLDEGDYMGQTLTSPMSGEAYKISTGHRHTVVLTKQNRVIMWGDNSYGQSGWPGDSFSDVSNTPVFAGSTFTGTFGDVLDVDAGAYNTCLIRGPLNESGDVWCKGRSTVGQSGFDDSANQTAGTGSEDWHQLPITDAVQVSVGADHACALTKQGKVKCWGRNVNGALGVSTSVVSEFTHIPQEVPNFRAKFIWSTFYSTFAITANGELYSWGDDTFGVLGHGTINGHVSTPTKVEGLENVNDVSGNWYTVLIRTGNEDDARYYGIGNNQKNQISNTSDDYFNTPVEIIVPVLPE